MKNNILIAEDDKDIVEILKLYLEDDDINIIATNDGKTAYDTFLKDDICLALIDIMMPSINGYNLIKMVRKQSNIPIIVISAKSTDEDKVLGLNLGADDYITKPFNPLEVVARVKSQLRRYNVLGANTSNNILKVGGLVLNQDDISVTKDDKKLNLTPLEFKILQLLMKSPGRVYTKSQIYTALHGDYFESDENTLMVHISKLRSKIDDDRYIKTIRSLGYKIEKQ